MQYQFAGIATKVSRRSRCLATTSRRYRRVDHQEDMSKLGASLVFQFFLKERAVGLPSGARAGGETFLHSRQRATADPVDCWICKRLQWLITGEVVSRLNDSKPSDLGIVARLGKSTPSVNEVVAPAMFYQPPVLARRPDIRSRSCGRRCRDGDHLSRSRRPRSLPSARRLSGGHPFTVKWPSPPALKPAGRYRVVLSGYFLDTNKPIQQTVTFYHQPPVVGQ